jgi:osmotically inducible lipoprotein OsmB
LALRLQFNTTGVQMKSRLVMAALAASLLGLTGCANMDRETVGTVGGAVVGGVLGNAVAGTGGAIVGGAAGAYVGNKAVKR